MTKRFVDLSHAIASGLETYPGLPAPLVGAFMSHADSRGRYAPGTTFHIGRIEMVANTGTYLDAPFHRHPTGTDIAGLTLETIADLRGIVIASRATRIDLDPFRGRDVRGKAVLVHTGWSTRWGSAEYFEGHPWLAADVAEWLVTGGARLVGIDSLNIDSTDDPTRPLHTVLLAAGIPIVEHLCNLDRLPAEGFRFFAVPAKVQGLGSFPVRAFAICD